MYIYINDKMQLENAPAINAGCNGMLYGYGLFETIKVNNKYMYFFDEHIERMKLSCSILNMSFTAHGDALYKNCMHLIEINNIVNGSIRISFIKDVNDNIILIQTKTNAYSKEMYDIGFKLCISSIVKNPLSPLCRVKSMNYAENIMAKNSAMSKGFDEAIFININKHLTEGAVSNIFWTKDNNLCTPSIECGLLSGIIRKKVIMLTNQLNISCLEDKYFFEDLYNADEIFITNSLMGIMPVSKLENKEFIIGMDNNITSILMANYDKLETFQNT